MQYLLIHLQHRCTGAVYALGGGNNQVHIYKLYDDKWEKLPTSLALGWRSLGVLALRP